MPRPAKLATVLALVIGVLCASASAEEGAMRNVFPQDLQWQPAEGFAAGTEIAIVHGDPERSGTLVYRLRLPAGTRLEPLKHSDERWFTVLQGTLAIGMGEAPDWDALEEQKERSFFAVPQNTFHYGIARTNVTLQIQTIGPVPIR